MSGETNKDSRTSRLHAALDLMEFGIELMRQNIVRRAPERSKEAVNAELQKWLSHIMLRHSITTCKEK